MFAWLRLCGPWSETAGEISDSMEYVPGLGVVPRLRDADRWRLAGQYASTHQYVGPVVPQALLALRTAL